MKFSVIVASHFRPLPIKRLLDSLAEQTFPLDDFEVVIVPSPGDVAIPVLEEYCLNSPFKMKIAIPPHDPWNGRSVAFKRNYGVKHSSNPWIAITDDDCFADRDWLRIAAGYITNEIAAMEGEVKIPPPKEVTVTSRGMMGLSYVGGFQTCNMFYRRDIFEKVGGFDHRFPFYFEDSDLAWSVQKLGFSIIFAKGAIINHPVFPNNPWKLIEAARRIENLVLLELKHPQKFLDNKMHFFGKAWSVLILINILTVFSLFFTSITLSLSLIALYFLLIILQVIRLYRGTVYTKKEILIMIYLNSYLPLFALYSYLKGVLKYRLKSQKSL
jgi:glycosyltransferase involved in cell wall biosynthesis